MKKWTKSLMKRQELSIKKPRQYLYDQANVGDRKSDFSFIKQPQPENTVKKAQADVTSWTLSKPTGERYEKIIVLDSKDVSETLFRLLKLQAAPEAL